MASHHQTAILGGGLAGLSASMVCGAPVFEAAGRAGGVGSSDRVGDFVFDRGIHVLNTKSPKVLGFLADLGLRMERINRVAEIYSHGVYTAYPFQVNTSRLPLALRVRCLKDFLQREKHPEPSNYEEWMYRNIGTSFAETFLIPYSEKFWGVSPQEMTFEWTGNKVPKPSTLQVFRGAFWNRQTAVGSNAVFHYPDSDEGYGAIAAAIERRAGTVHTGYRATSLDPAAREVGFENGERIRYDTLVSTIALPELVRIARDVPEEIGIAASRLRTNSIMVVNLGIGRARMTGKHWVHFPEKDISFFRLSFPSNFSARLAPPGTSSVSCEVSYDPRNPPDPEVLTDRVIDDLKRVGIMRGDDPVVLRHTHDIPYGYCIYDLNRKSSVRAVREWLEENGVIPCGRYGLWTYFWSDEAVNSGRQAGEKVLRLQREAA